MFKAVMMAAAVFVALPAAAQDAAPAGRARGTAEISRDVFLTRAQARAERRFARIDADGNGVLSRDERAADRERSRAAWQARQVARADRAAQ